jgi:4a-hydroxytetrahydrobiopterin dehydratase
MKALTIREIKNQIKLLPNWKYQKGFLQRSFEFSSFKKAINFLNEVAYIAEAKDHHPMLLNNFNILEIKLSTHDVNGISQKDFDLALDIEKLHLKRSNQ